MVKNLPSNAGDVSLTLGQGLNPIRQCSAKPECPNNRACTPQLEKPDKEINVFKTENISIKQEDVCMNKAGSMPSTAVYTHTPLCAVESHKHMHTHTVILREVLKLPINLLNPRVLQPLFYHNN